MAIQIQGYSNAVAEVDGTGFRALRTTIRPTEYGSLGFYRAHLVSGVMAVSLGANSEIFQFRWSDATRLCAIQKVMISAAPSVAASTAVAAEFRLTKATGWTVAGSGGNRVTPAATMKLRTSMGSSLVAANDIGIASTGALTAGTKTLEGNDMTGLGFGIGTGAITTAASLQWVPPRTPMYDEDAGDHPLLLIQNEGFVIRNGGNAFPAGATWILTVDVVWSELNAF